MNLHTIRELDEATSLTALSAATLDILTHKKVQQCALQALLTGVHLFSAEAGQICSHTYLVVKYSARSFQQCRKGHYRQAIFTTARVALHTLHIVSFYSGGMQLAIITHAWTATIHLIQGYKQYKCGNRQLKMSVHLLQAVSNLNEAFSLYCSAIAIDGIVRSLPLGDPKKYLLTINAHGGYSEYTFKLPDNVYVLTPHPKGLDVPYSLSVPDKPKMEELIYRWKPNQLPFTTANGWHLAKPGDLVHNLHIFPWTSNEYARWAKRTFKKDLSYVSKGPGGIIKAFSWIPARWKSMKQIV